MQIFRVIAGYSYGRADVVRRMMSKKKVAEMEKEREYFLHGKINDDGSVECTGAVSGGMTEESAEKIYREMAEFAKYAFNKSHACAYAVLAYRTAYLKSHYPSEYMASLLTSVVDSDSKILQYTSECKRMGISILPPDVNYSGVDFTADKSSIRFGLLAIKNVGRILVESIICEREKRGKFDTFENFLERMYGREMHKGAVEYLIKSGALDSLGHRRDELLGVLDQALELLQKRKSLSASGQFDMFSALGEENSSFKLNYPDTTEFTYKQMLEFEKDASGMYFSGHPLDNYANEYKRIGALTTAEISEAANDSVDSKIKDGSNVISIGIVKNIKTKITKNDAKMAFATFEDLYGRLELIIFPKVYESVKQSISGERVIAVKATVNVSEAYVSNGEDAHDEAKLILKEVIPVYSLNEVKTEQKEKDLQEKSTIIEKPRSNPNEPYKPPQRSVTTAEKKQRLFLRIPSENSEVVNKVVNLLEIFTDGSTPVFAYYEESGVIKKIVDFGVVVNPTMITMLKRYLGEKNVAIKD